MKIKNFTTEASVFENREELSKEDAVLLQKAHEAAKNAYAPYSLFQVGAAILLENGEVVTGNNQENAAYPSGLCAERTAAFYASSHFPNVPFRKIAVTAINPKKTVTEPISPCGGCRQVLLEYEGKFRKKIEILLAGETGEVYKIKSASDLLPCSFHAGFLS